MSKEITDTKVQVESSLAASKRSVDESTRESKSTVVLDDNPGNETHDDATISSVRVVLLGILLLVIGAMGFYYLPGMVATNAKGSKLVNSIYCSVITLTTIGFGDICPGSALAPISKLFIVLFSFSGLGFFCGPMLDITSSMWTKHIPGGILTLSFVTIGIGAILFSNLENISQSDAIYASFIVGTTIGYGDYTPKSDLGKLAVAGYAIMVVNVMAGLLKPSRIFLENLCRVTTKSTAIVKQAKLGEELTKKKDD